MKSYQQNVKLMGDLIQKFNCLKTVGIYDIILDKHFTTCK